MGEETSHWRYPRLSDQELLRSIGRDMQQLYSEMLREPLPSKIEALVHKIEEAESDETRQKKRQPKI
jgi:hypothetical protein